MLRIVFRVNEKDDFVLFSHDTKDYNEIVRAFLIEYGMSTVPSNVLKSFISKCYVKEGKNYISVEEILE